MLRRFFSFRRPKLDEKETVDELEKENIAPNSQVQGKNKFKGTGSWFSACSLIKLLFSNLLVILSIKNPTHMYLSDLKVYFKVEVHFRVTWSRMEGH